MCVEFSIRLISEQHPRDQRQNEGRMIRQFICDTSSADREVRRPTAYDHAMGFIRSAMGFFRGGARKHRDERAAELLKEQAAAVTTQPAVADQGMMREEGAAGLLDQQAAAVTTQLAAAGREVKREARPNPNKPGWGLSIGQEVGKPPKDGASRE
jgi:hypothetical protein